MSEIKIQYYDSWDEDGKWAEERHWTAWYRDFARAWRTMVDDNQPEESRAVIEAYQRGHTDGSNDRLAEFKRAEG